MAVPTITSITPSQGLTRGDNLVKIVGTNFRTPPPPPATGPLDGPQQKTINVKFENQESLWAYAASDTLILARVPEYRGPNDLSFPLSLDLRVANLDDDEVEIAGENIVSAGAYSIDRQSFATECYFQRVIRAFQHIFKRHVYKNVFVTVSRNAANEQLNDKRLQAEAPAIYLIGPNVTTNRFDSINREDIEVDTVDPNEWFRRRVPVTVDFDFELTLVAKKSSHLYSMVQSSLLLFRDITEVRVTDDPGDDQVNPAGNYKDYEIEMPWQFGPDIDDDPNDSDLYKVTAGVKIRGVHIDDEAGTVIERGWNITQNDGIPTLDTQTIKPEGL